jgi:Flp pilus assembly protein TadG
VMYRHLRQEKRGQALVEFALIVPVFILLLVGLFDLGRGVFAFNTISNAAREAARVAIVDQDCTTIKN